MQKCPSNGRECRHCSKEHAVTVERVLVKTGKTERREVRTPLGEWCNNDGRHYVRELKECPTDIALGVPLVPYVESELDWSKRRN
jgi:hypothetical protein